MRWSGLIAAVVLGGAVSGARGEWSSFRGPNHDGVSDEKIAWKSAKPVWRAEVGAGFGTVAVGAGKVFLTAEGGGQEALLALDEKTGAAKWHYVIGRTIYERQGGDGPRTTPAVDGKRVYALGTYLNLVCVDAESGKAVWSHDIAREFNGQTKTSGIDKWGNAASPVVDGGHVYVCGGGRGETFIAFDKETGKVAWKTGDEKLTHATPTVATIHGVRQVIFFVQSGLVSLEAETGKELWRFGFPFNVSTAGTPVVAGEQKDVVFCSAGYNSGAAAARVAKEGERWTVTEMWRNTDPHAIVNHWTSSVYKDGYLYGIYGFKKYNPGDKAPLKCVELATGKVMWEKPGFGPGGTILCGDTLVVQGDEGQVALVKATPEGYRAVGGAVLQENAKCWNAAVVSNGRLYARSTRTSAKGTGAVVCVDVAAK